MLKSCLASERREPNEHQETYRLHYPVYSTGSSHCSYHATDEALLRNRSFSQRQTRKRCSRCRGGVSAKHLSRYCWILPPQPASNAGVLSYLRELPRGADHSHGDRLDAECCHLGGRPDPPRAGVVHPSGAAIRMVQIRAPAANRRQRTYLPRLNQQSVLY